MSVTASGTGMWTADNGGDITDLSAGGFLVISRFTITVPQQQFFSKGTPTQFRATTTNLSIDVVRATTSLTVTAAPGDFTGYGAGGRWFCIAGRFDLAAASSAQQLFAGPLDGPLAEPSVYASQNVGSGARTSDAANTLYVGNSGPAGARAITSPFFACALFAAYPSLEDFYAVRDRLLETNARPVFPSNVARAWRFDRSGTGTAIDLANQVAAVPSSTIQTAQDPPRRYPVRVAAWDVIPAVAATGRGVRFDRRRRFIASEE